MIEPFHNQIGECMELLESEQWWLSGLAYALLSKASWVQTPAIPLLFTQILFRNYGEGKHRRKPAHAQTCGATQECVKCSQTTLGPHGNCHWKLWSKPSYSVRPEPSSGTANFGRVDLIFISLLTRRPDTRFRH